MYSFLIAAVTDYRKFSGLKQPRFIILQFWSSEVQSGSGKASRRKEFKLRSEKGVRIGQIEIWGMNVPGRRCCVKEKDLS